MSSRQHSDAFIFHTDPGHGWLQVTPNDLKCVNLNPTDFSDCSYRKGNIFYLEEDCDAPKFLAAHRAKFGNPKITELHKEVTPIRGYPRIY